MPIYRPANISLVESSVSALHPDMSEREVWETALKMRSEYELAYLANAAFSLELKVGFGLKISGYPHETIRCRNNEIPMFRAQEGYFEASPDMIAISLMSTEHGPALKILLDWEEEREENWVHRGNGTD
jgi:hypothetical protein